MEKTLARWSSALRMMLLAAAFSIAASVSAFAANGKLSFSDPSVTAGSDVNVTMKISADEGTALSDATVTLKYPSDKLTFVSGTDAAGGAGTIRVKGASNGQGTSTLEYNLKFQTASAGDFSISVDTYEVYDGAGQAVTLTHVGSSAVKVQAEQSASSNADLKTLEVDPGTLSPAFSAGTTAYQLTVGLSVDKLGINALAADSSANVAVSGNDALKDGDNTVTVTVTAPDGQTTKTYTLTVTKQEGGPESSGTQSADDGQATVEGVQLSSKGKTITIMNPSADVQIPQGLKDGTLSIDGQKVKGWVWGTDTGSDPQYCVVYGMNDQGELNFYRYDLTEKTIQRYFVDPLAADAVSNQEYSTLMGEYQSMQHSSEVRFLIICVLAVLCLVLLALLVYVSSKLRNAAQTPRRPQRRNGGRGGMTGMDSGAGAGNDASVKFSPEEQKLQDTLSRLDNLPDDDAILHHSFEASDELAFPEGADANDETQVIRRPERRKRQRREVSGDTMPIPRIHGGMAAEENGVQPEENAHPDVQPENSLEENGNGSSENGTEGTAGSQENGSADNTAHAAKESENAGSRSGFVSTEAQDQSDDEFETFDL